MMLLLFSVGKERYGIDASHVSEVLPYLKLKPLHKTPAYVAGVANCRGNLIPVLDISHIFTKKYAPNRLSTRIILVKLTGANGSEHTMGILAEKVTSTLQLEETPISSEPQTDSSESLLGQDLIMVDEQIIQRVNVDDLLPEYLQKRLFNARSSAKVVD